MADINLLSTNNQSPVAAQHQASLVVKIIAVVLVLVVLYYGYLWYQASRVNNRIEYTQSQIGKTQAEALAMKERSALITRQGQLQTADTLVKNHVFWSYLLPELARVTLKSTSYATIAATSEGVLNLTVTAPSYADLDKYLQVFNLPQYNKEFSDVKVLSIIKAQDENTLSNEMKLQLKFNPAFIRNRLDANVQ
jgi:hypothetical protein